MKKFYLALIALFFYSLSLQAQIIKPSKVSIDDYEKLIAEVKEHRKTRLLNLDQFNAEAKKLGVIILDARSDAMYNTKHIKGAIHLNFSDFTQEALAKVIPSFDTEILIYCNNNFEDDSKFFPTKMVVPNIINVSNVILPPTQDTTESPADTKTEYITTMTKPITLALNIPTYTNLYGYGYRNVYELSEFVSIYDSRLEFEGTAVNKK